MTDSERPPDYAAMSGAEMRRAVGADPEKWADAFCQMQRTHGLIELDWVTAWFRDAMEAAVRAK